MMTTGCSNRTSTNQPSGAQIALSWGVQENQLDDTNRFKAELTITNNSAVTLINERWTLYFNFLRTVLPESLPPSVSITRINGDFVKLEPTEVFAPLEPGQSLSITLEGQDWIISESEAPCGFYFVFTDENGRSLPPEAVVDVTIEPHVTKKQTDRSAGDNMAVPTPASRYAGSQGLEQEEIDSANLIVPTPIHIDVRRNRLALNKLLEIHLEAGLENEAYYLAEALKPLFGRSVPVSVGIGGGSNIIVLRLGEVLIDGINRQRGDEAYVLRIDPGIGIEIIGTDEAGVFYGIQSLRALIPIEAYHGPQETITVPQAVVRDAPRFVYRGQHLDVARNFQTKEAVKKMLDLMAFYKLNKFHFHLSDDEGWRLAITPLPELTEIGGFRGHTTDEMDHLVPSYGSGPDPDPSVSNGSGFYTRADFVELLRYARDRHIEVIPEIDVPGHARAAIKAMEVRYTRLVGQESAGEPEAFLLSDPDDQSAYVSVQGWNDNVINVCLPSTYHFLETVVDDIVDMYAEAEAPLTTFHVGGDELPRSAWERSPVCESLLQSAEEESSVADLTEYFWRKLHAILAKHGLATAGWEEIALTEAPDHNQPIKQQNAAFLDMGLIPYVWDSIWGWGMEGNAYQLANAGYKVVLCNATNLYFDLAYNKDPQEPGYYWAGFVDTKKAYEFVPFDLYKSAKEDRMGNPIDVDGAFRNHARLNSTSQGNILGIQGQLWGENAKGQDWMEYLAFPKLLGLAERAWAQQPVWATIEDKAEREVQFGIAWSAFANSLGQRELPRLDYLYGGVNYRIPLPGAIVEDGILSANVAYPGLTIRYTTDGTEPSLDSPRYTDPVQVQGTVKIKTFDTRGRSSRLSVVEVE